MTKAVPYMIGIGELQRKASSVVKEIDSRKEEGFIVSHNQPKAVIMSLKRYQKLKAFEEARRAEEDEVLSIVKQGDREYEEGKTKKARSLGQFI